MNAEEIRQTRIEEPSKDFWLREIAAQLAELVYRLEALEMTMRLFALQATSEFVDHQPGKSKK